MSPDGIAQAMNRNWVLGGWDVAKPFLCSRLRSTCFALAPRPGALGGLLCSQVAARLRRALMLGSVSGQPSLRRLTRLGRATSTSGRTGRPRHGQRHKLKAPNRNRSSEPSSFFGWSTLARPMPDQLARACAGCAASDFYVTACQPGRKLGFAALSVAAVQLGRFASCLLAASVTVGRKPPDQGRSSHPDQHRSGPLLCPGQDSSSMPSCQDAR